MTSQKERERLQEEAFLQECMVSTQREIQKFKWANKYTFVIIQIWMIAVTHLSML